MNGVEILSMTEVVTEYTYNYWLAGIIYLLLVIGCGIFGAVVYYVNCGNWLEGAGIGILLSGILGLFIFAVVCVASQEPIAYETQYKVLLDESIQLTEFLEKYEILGQDGKIYIIRERSLLP